MKFRSRRVRELRPLLRELASYRFHFSALASATSNGIGERLHQQRILGSGGCHFVIRYVVADKLHVVCFQKSSCCLSCFMLVPSCFAMLPSWGPHCPPANATDPPLWLLHQAIRAGDLRHLLVFWAFSFADRARHVEFAFPSMIN